MNQELAQIQKQFDEVISYSQTGIANPNTHKLFEDWLEAKRDFIEAFGGKLIVEFPETITFTLTQEERQKRVDDFCQMVASMSSTELVNFIKSNSEGFFNNQVMFQYNSDMLKIPKGMKLVKAFKYFESDPDILSKLQSAASMIIQENCVSGKLCLSVHPLDYLSASENNHNWRSCHALDGDYRAGNLSYMVDSSTIICYIKTKDDEILPDFPDSVPWNSKKWRVWLFMSNDWKVVFAGRQYPFSSFEGMTFIKDKFLPQCGLGHFGDWLETSTSFLTNKLTGEAIRARYPYILIGGYIKPLHEVVFNKPGSLQFNDLLSSSTYTPMYAHKEDETGGIFNLIPSFNANYDTKVIVGGKVKCLRCGEHDIELSGSMMCTTCELIYGDCDDDSIELCPCCGERYLYDEGVYIQSSDTVICPSCADNWYTPCSICGELVASQDAIYDEKRDYYICLDCKEYEQEQIELNREYERELL